METTPSFALSCDILGSCDVWAVVLVCREKLSRVQLSVNQLRDKLAAPDYSRLVPEAVQDEQK